MSILADGLTDHHVADFRDSAAVISLLSPTVPELLRVRDYWRSVDPQSKEVHPAWSVVHHGEGPDEHLAYYGPGGFSVHFGPRVAVVGAGCRYIGFATIPALQAAHLPAFRAVARALGGTRLLIIPEDNGPISDAALYSGASLDECAELIRKAWCDPQLPTEVVTEDLDVYYRRKVPIWYVEVLENVA
jgi:hypothetical protein